MERCCQLFGASLPMVGVILPLAFAGSSACTGCGSISSARHPLGDIRICSGSSRRAAFDVLASVRLRLARSARVSSLDVLLAVSPRSRAHEVHIPVRVCGVLCGPSECIAALRGLKGTLFDTHFTRCSLSQDLLGAGRLSLERPSAWGSSGSQKR